MYSKSDNLGYLKDQKRKNFLGLCCSECPSPKTPTLKCLLHLLICIYFFPDSRFVCGGMSGY